MSFLRLKTPDLIILLELLVCSMLKYIHLAQDRGRESNEHEELEGQVNTWGQLVWSNLELNTAMIAPTWLSMAKRGASELDSHAVVISFACTMHEQAQTLDDDDS
jgi:hypothetical protein